MNTETNTSSDAPRRKKRWPKVLGVIVVLLVLLVVFAPALIATLGKGTVESTINGTIKGSVAIDSLSLSWLGGQSVTGLELRDPDGNVVATVAGVSTELTVLQAIRGDLNLGKTVIAGLVGDIRLDANGVSNLQKAIEPVEPSPETDEPAAVPPSLKIDAQITGANVKVTPHEGAPSELSDLEVVAAIRSMTDPVTFTATGTPKQGDSAGKLTINGSLANLFAADGSVTPEKVDADIVVDMTKTPTALLDGLAPLDGLIGKALGATINQIKVTAKGTLESQVVTATVDTDYVQARSLRADVADGVATLAESSPIRARVTPTLYNALVASSDSGSPMRLTAPAVLELDPKTLRLPLDPEKLADAAIALVLTSVDPIKLAGDEALGEVTASNVKISLGSDGLGGDTEITLNADLVTDGQPGKVAINATASGLIGPKGEVQAATAPINGSATLQGVPTALLNRLVPIELSVDEAGKPRYFDFTWLGRMVDVTAPIGTTVDAHTRDGVAGQLQTVTADLTVTTDNASGPFAVKLPVQIETFRSDAGDTQSGRVANMPDRSASLNWAMPRAAAVALGVPENVQLGEVTPIEIKDLTFAAPLPPAAVEGKSAPPAFQPDKTRLAGSLSVGDLVYRVDETNTLTLSRIEAKIAGDSLVNMTVEASTSIIIPETSATLRGQAGERIDAKLDGTIKTTDLANFDPANVDALLEATLDAQGGQLRELFGGKATITLTKKPVAADNFSLAVASDRVTANVPGTLTLGDNAALATKAATLNATVRPELVASLKEPTTAALEIAPTTIPLSGFTTQKLKAQVTGGFDRIVLAAEGAADGTVLTGMKFTEPVVFNGPAGTINAKLNGRALGPGQTGEGSPIDVDAKLANIFDADGALAIATAKIDATVNVKDMPTSVVDAIAELGGKLPPIVGPTVNLDAVVATTGGPASNGTATVNLRGSNLSTTTDVKLTDGVITPVQGKPTTIKWTMTPEAFAKLTTPAVVAEGTPEGASASGEVAKPVATLNEPTLITVIADSFSIKLAKENEPFDIRQVALNATLKSDAIKMTDNKTGKAVTIDGLNGSVTSSRFSEGIKVVSRSTVATAGVPTPGKLELDANLSELFGPDGGFNKTAYNAAVTAKLVEIPGSLAEALFGSGSNKVAALIGESGTIEFEVDMKSGQGPAKITIDSQNTQLLLDGRIENSVFRLNEDVSASIMITEELTDVQVGGSVVDILAKMMFGNPLLKQAVKSIEPAKLRIAAKGFEVPIEDFDITKVKIENATLNPGKLIVENAGLINTLITLPSNVRGLNPSQLLKDMSAKNNIEAWFTDMPFSMTNGVARLSRMDMMLGNNYQVAIWGTINLSDAETAAGNEMLGPQSGRLVLGLAERAMRRVYGISAFKDDPNYVDQFIMKGPLETLGPNQTEMVGRIGLLTGLGAAGVGNQGIGILKTIGAGGRILSGKEKSPPPPPAPAAPWPSEEEEKAAEEAAQEAAKDKQPAAPAEPSDAPDKPEPTTEPQPEPEPDPKTEPESEPAPKRQKPKSDKEKLEDLGKDLLRDLLK